MLLDRLVVTGPRVSHFDSSLRARSYRTAMPPLGDRRPKEEAECESGGGP
jgi:hypothetical protein